MAGWWDSVSATRRLSRRMTVAAGIGLAAGLAALPMTLFLAIPAFVLGTTAILVALFAWFRWQHLSELDRLR
jgi:xanthine/uracil permease